MYNDNGLFHPSFGKEKKNCWSIQKEKELVAMHDNET